MTVDLSNTTLCAYSDGGNAASVCCSVPAEYYVSYPNSKQDYTPNPICCTASFGGNDEQFMKLGGATLRCEWKDTADHEVSVQRETVFSLYREMHAYDRSDMDAYGYSVATDKSGRLLAVGAPMKGGGRGAVS